MVVPSQPWQGAPAARAPLHPHRLTGFSESPSACPDACDAGRGNVSGDRRSRCNVWPLHHQSGGAFLLPRHPHDHGETSLSPGPHRPTVRRLDAVRAVAPRTTSMTWRLPSPPAPNHGQTSCPFDRHTAMWFRATNPFPRKQNYAFITGCHLWRLKKNMEPQC